MAIGTWIVTTDDDEDRLNLGVWSGEFADIAFHLADKAIYSLSFEEVPPTTQDLFPTRDAVHVSFAGECNKEKAIRRAADLTLGKRVSVEASNAYAAAALRLGITPQEREEMKKKVIAKRALAKLTDEERRALGL